MRYAAGGKNSFFVVVFGLLFGFFIAPVSVFAAPSIDGTISAGEYKASKTFSGGTFEFYWTIIGNTAYIGMRGRTTGNIAIGVAPTPYDKMNNTDIAIGYVSGGSVFLRDDFGDSQYTHVSDASLGGGDNILSKAGSESGGATTIEFSRPVAASDSFDQQIRTSGQTTVIWANGPSGEDTFSAAHDGIGGGNVPPGRGSGQVNFGDGVEAQQPSFDFSMSNGGAKSVIQGGAVSNSISISLSAGQTEAVTLSYSGLPSGASASFSRQSCSPNCSVTISITTSASTRVGERTITVIGSGGGKTKTTSFSLSVSGAVEAPACSDGEDNDSDGLIDYPSDLGCTSASDGDETDVIIQTPQCSDGSDNDGDGLVDYPSDTGCSGASDNDEYNPPQNSGGGQNEFPGAASNPSPAAGSTNVPVSITLEWDEGTGGVLTHDVYFGSKTPPKFRVGQLSDTSLDVGDLDYNTTYYWRIAEWTADGITVGPVWSFVTRRAPSSVSGTAMPTGAASDPSPADGAANVSIDADLDWEQGSEDVISSDVYFGESKPPKLNRVQLDDSALGIPRLKAGTKYYWRVAEWTEGGFIVGPIWSFTTRPAAGNSTQTAQMSDNNAIQRPASQISIGGRVKTTAGLNARRSAEITNLNIINQQAAGSLGSVIDGPVNADGYTWWKVNYDNGVKGWSAGEFLIVSDAGVPSGNTTDTSTSSAFDGVFRRYLERGYDGDDVNGLQKKLLALGFFPNGVNTTFYFGPVTERAVKDYQCSRAIVCGGSPGTTGFGRVGPKTKSALNNNLPESGNPMRENSASNGGVNSGKFKLARDLDIGSNGSDVRALQDYLKSVGVFPQDVDSSDSYGETTAASVRRYQCSRDIVCEGTAGTTGFGRVGPKTRSAINSGQ